MPRQWFLKTKTGVSSPITSKTLIRMAAKGKLKPSHGVSADGIAWIKAKQIVGLTFPDAIPPRYWVRTKGGDAGPFTIAKLNQLASVGRIKPAVMVSDDAKVWFQAKQISGLRFPEPKPEPVSFASERRAEYQCRFGRPSDPFHFGESAIEVLPYPSNQLRPIATMVTCGISDQAVRVWSDRDSSRIELVLYADVATRPHAKCLHRIAEQIVRNEFAVAYGATMEFDEPLFASERLDGCVFLIPNIESDFAIRTALRIDDQPLHLMWVVPTTKLERDLINEQGIAAFCSLLDRHQHGLTIQAKRECYITAESQFVTASIE